MNVCIQQPYTAALLSQGHSQVDCILRQMGHVSAAAQRQCYVLLWCEMCRLMTQAALLLSNTYPLLWIFPRRLFRMQWQWCAPHQVYRAVGAACQPER